MLNGKMSPFLLIFTVLLSACGKHDVPSTDGVASASAWTNPPSYYAGSGANNFILYQNTAYEPCQSRCVYYGTLASVSVARGDTILIDNQGDALTGKINNSNAFPINQGPYQYRGLASADGVLTIISNKHYAVNSITVVRCTDGNGSAVTCP